MFITKITKPKLNKHQIINHMFINNEGPTENRTRITGIKIPCTNHYTMGP